MQTKRFGVVVVVLSCLGVALPSAAMAAPTISLKKPVAAPARDVVLHDAGVLVGQMVSPQGAAVAGATVTVQKAGKEIVRLKTDRDGKFRVVGLTGGVHLVSTANQQSVYRLWAPQTAPPAAQSGLMLVSSTDVVRGQCGCGTPVCGSSVCGSRSGGAYGRAGGGGGIGGWMANHPLMTTGAIASAIAIPLALDDDDDPPATP